MTKGPEFDEFAEHIRAELVPEITESKIVLSITPEDPSKFDATFAVQLGVAVVLDKPILLVIRPGQKIPGKLRRVADLIVEVDWNNPEDAREQMENALQEMKEMEW